MVIVDFKRIEGVSSEWILQHVRAGQEVVTQEFEANGFRLVDTQDFLKENYLLRFERRASSGEGEDHPQSSAWKPVEGQLLTRWAKHVAPDKAWEEYPRPQLVRHAWSNLNGLWDYAIRPKDENVPPSYEGKILVPFAVESALSGVKKPVTPQQRLWYQRTFELPDAARGKRCVAALRRRGLACPVWVNGRRSGSIAGATIRSRSISPALCRTGPQQLTVAFGIRPMPGTQPRGKQVLEPEGIWYTAVTGIWQTVWLEPVPRTYHRVAFD